MIRRLGCGALGCFGSVALLLIALGVGWFGFVQPAIRSVTGQIESTISGQPTQNLPQPPAASAEDATAPLTRAEVEAFVRIRREVRTAMGTTFPQLQELYTDIQAGQPVNWWTAVQAVQALGSSVADARAAVQRGLADEHMSAERYAFVRSKVNRALGLPDVNLSEILSQLGQAQQSQTIPDLSGTVTTATEEERALVQPHAEILRVTAPLSLLGL